jgi:hypothetical protein
LLDRVSGNKVDEEENEAYYQPDDWEGIEHALDDGSQWSVLG